VAESKISRDVILPRKSYSVETLVGLFVVIGLGCLAYLAITIAKMQFLNTGFYELNAEFDNVAGLDAGAPVEIAGVPVGEVTNIILKPPSDQQINGTSAVVTMKIRDGVRLREDDMIAIRTKGIIGERYVKVAPGGSDSFVPQGGKIINTESAVEFEDIVGKLIHRME